MTTPADKLGTAAEGSLITDPDHTEQEPPMQHPDFELYDNVGRDADQIAAARYSVATKGDLLRWARRDSEPFVTAHPLPDEPLPSPDLAPYLGALHAAETPAEASAVTQRLLDAAEPVLRAVSEYLVAAARWRDQHRGAEKGSPPKLLMEAASRSLSVLAIADEADLTILRAEYDPAPAPAPVPPGQSPATSGLPPASPRRPPTGPARGR
ncbi:hypothetical protein AB0D14_32705 [Streptomyces sp. NPDC048484]|uniref:hypothetical protein n=1 Tax=Streptomyces sp. NPDC048484 TaxID=3155146 RepID=UPI00342628DA